jgi:hypothetical protein
MKTIKVEIDPTGKVILEGKGFQGTECDSKMKAFESALGKVEQRKELPEYHQGLVIHTAQQKIG